MRIGLLLGSFDPIHYGHIAMSSAVLNSGLCDKILFVVAKQNPWKNSLATPFDVRCKMVEASISQFLGKCEVCQLEKYLDPPTFSYKVLELIKRKYPTDEFFIIVGTDTVKTIHNWMNFNDKIKPYFNFIEIARGDVYKEKPKDDEQFIVIQNNAEGIGNYNCIIPKVTDVSSTMIRKMINNNMNPYPYVNENVIKIINQYKLYK